MNDNQKVAKSIETFEFIKQEIEKNPRFWGQDLLTIIYGKVDLVLQTLKE